MAKVEIYTKATCGYCWRAKELLAHKQVEFTEHAVDFGGPVKQTMVNRAKGRLTVPQIFIDERHVGGCDDLLALERSGELDALIGAANE
ncbi:MAG: glutaredoxin 3 [Sphingomicrobium sp.]